MEKLESEYTIGIRKLIVILSIENSKKEVD